MELNAAMLILQQRSSTTDRESECAICAELGDSPVAAPNDIPAPVSLQSVVGMSVEELLRLMLQQQGRRLAEYRRFEEGFKNFLRVEEAQGYQALVASTTARFSEISATVNIVREQLEVLAAASDSLNALASAMVKMIKKMQELEREKLTLTAQLQIVRHGEAVHALQHAHTDEEEGDAQKNGHSNGQAGGRDLSYAHRSAQLRQAESAELRQRFSRVEELLRECEEEVRCELADLVGEDSDAEGM
eukprot:6183907-Pleurochrysis_carterae.AAC.1